MDFHITDKGSSEYEISSVEYEISSAEYEISSVLFHLFPSACEMLEPRRLISLRTKLLAVECQPNAKCSNNTV